MDKDALFNLIIDLLPANIYWKNCQGQFLGSNLRQARSDGFDSPEALLGKTVNDTCKDPVLAKKVAQTDEQVMLTRKPMVQEEQGFDESGKLVIYLSHKVPIFDAHQVVVGLLGVSLDITEYKAAEMREKLALSEAAVERTKAQAADEMQQAVTVLAGSIAHDLRTPLSTINLLAGNLGRVLPILMEAYQKASKANLLQDTIHPHQLKQIEPLGEYLRETVAEANGFITVTLKMLSKAVTGGLKKEDLIQCSIDECIEQTLRRFPFIDNERDWVHYEKSCNFIFWGNAVLMLRVLFNLLKNSLYQIKNNRRGQIYIATSTDRGVNYLKIKDTAGGIPNHLISQLFEGFSTTKKEGMGIGLAFCKRAMKSFGGNIHCDSVEGDYVEFTLSFPAGGMLEQKI